MTDNNQKWAETNLGYNFKNAKLLASALTHKSASSNNYERLEFLGDRILGLVVAEWLMVAFPNEPEGKLTRRFHQMVSRESCAAVARRIGVPQVVQLGQQARTDGGANSDNILGDVVEALIGAIHMDGGMEAARETIRKLWDDVTTASEAPKHPKMQLQEWAASKQLKLPVYTMIGRTGPHHNPRFNVELVIAPFPPVTAEGTSKQDAETQAAKTFLDTHAN